MNAVAVRTHVAGPPEKEPADNLAGWSFVQRCLRCDLLLTSADWYRLGVDVVEHADGKMAAAAGVDDGVPGCEPPPVRETIVIEAEE